jgi:hypothetical protein
MAAIDLWAWREAANQAALLVYLGRSPLAQGEADEQVTWIVTGVDSNDYNGVVYARFDAVSADARIPEIVATLCASGVPALCSSTLPARRPIYPPGWRLWAHGSSTARSVWPHP